jgi:hypothetical protein
MSAFTVGDAAFGAIDHSILMPIAKAQALRTSSAEKTERHVGSERNGYAAGKWSEAYLMCHSKCGHDLSFSVL